MRVSEIRPGELGETERGLWDAFQRPDGKPASAFMAWPFAVAVGDVRADARVAVIEDDEGVLAFVPYHRRGMGVARPIGAPFSDQHGPVVRPGAVLDLPAALKQLGLSAYLHTAMPVAEGAAAGPVFSSGPCYAADIEGDPAAYLEAKRGANRKRFKALNNRARKTEREMGAVEITLDDPDPAAYARILELKSRQYRESGMHDVLAPHWTPALFERLRGADIPGFHMYVPTLRADGKFLAGETSLLGAGALHSWITSYEPDFAEYSAGLQLHIALIQRLPEIGADRLDLGGGHGHYKSVFADAYGNFADGAVCAAGAAGAARRATIGMWRAAEAAPLGPVSSLAGKLRRRSGQIAAVEPDFAGRARGVMTAVSDMVPGSGLRAHSPAAAS